MKRAIFCAFICAVAGFAIAAYVGSVNPATAPSWMSTTVAYILCPPGILAGLSMTDPDLKASGYFLALSTLSFMDA